MGNVAKGVGLGIGFYIGTAIAGVVATGLAMMLLCGGCAAILGTGAVAVDEAVQQDMAARHEQSDAMPPVAANAPADQQSETDPTLEESASAEETEEPPPQLGPLDGFSPPASEPDETQQADREAEATAAVEQAIGSAENPTDVDAIDSLTEQLEATQEAHKGTAAVERIAGELAALAKLRLAYSLEERTGRRPTPRLSEIVADFPETIAGHAAQSRLDARAQ